MRQNKTSALDFEVGELNLVPYMDIMVNLIIFMLFTMTGFVQMKVINVSVPAINTAPLDASNEPTPPPENKLSIVLAILDKKGFVVSLSGQFMLEDGTLVDKLPDGGYSVGAKPDGSLDFAKLTAIMEKVKAKDPSITALTIVPEKSVSYEVIVKVMDAIRRDGKDQLMYPDVLLGVG